jgi:hypothetical protein
MNTAFILRDSRIAGITGTITNNFPSCSLVCVDSDTRIVSSYIVNSPVLHTDWDLVDLRCEVMGNFARLNVYCFLGKSLYMVREGSNAMIEERLFES